jgi:N-formylglutamate deformylase
MNLFDVIRGDGPIILGQPHGGTWLPDDVLLRLNDNGRRLADTDWHIARLYDGLIEDVTVVRSHVHRYGIDANRDPARHSLYPGQNTTDLCPLTDFDGNGIWREGQTPRDDEIMQRCLAWHRPYHTALAAEIVRLKALHGVVLVFDCHSIRSRIPYLFEGELPALSIGTDNGNTCSPALQSVVCDITKNADYRSVVNGRFRGGWTTRQYGQPHTGVHAIQLEIAQSCYLESEAAPWAYDISKAALLRPVLKHMLTALQIAAKDLACALHC